MRLIGIIGKLAIGAIVALTVLPVSTSAAEIPENFPKDIVIADYMVPISVMDVRGNFRVNLHVRNKPLGEVVAWFKTGMVKQGWEPDEGQTTSDEHATLPFAKDGRVCAIVITNAVLNASGKMDHSTRGITIHTAMRPVERKVPPAKKQK